MTPALETSSLRLRPLELADAAQVQILFPDWEIVRYLANKVPWPYPFLLTNEKRVAKMVVSWRDG
jgi:ribosomal-protein-alanine N-acetyltransferase